MKNYTDLLQQEARLGFFVCLKKKRNMALLEYKKQQSKSLNIHWNNAELRASSQAKKIPNTCELIHKQELNTFS